MYRKTPAGSNYTGDILNAPMGAGYGFIRQAIEYVIEKLSANTTNIILVGHVKDKTITSIEGKEIGSVKDFDLTGKIKNLY